MTREKRRRRTGRDSGLKPVLGILTAILAVQMVQSLDWSLPEGSTRGWIGNPAFTQGVLTLSGVGYSETSGWSIGQLFSWQSPALAQAWEEYGRPAPRPQPVIEIPDEPVIFVPAVSIAPVPTAAPAPEDSSAPPVQNIADNHDIDPYVSWIGGPYTPPDPNDPGARRLLEVTLLPSSASSYNSSGLVYVKNRVTDELDIGKIMSRESAIVKTAADAPQILIIHTHGSESFFPDERDYYLPTDIQRTEDTRFNVVRVGEQLAENLRALGLNVVHDTTICDMPSYSGSYKKALTVIEKNLAEYPGIQMVIDLHRDSLQSDNGTAYKVVSDTDRGKTAQLMFVMGTNLLGLHHPGWRDNLNLACQLQQAALERYPTLMRPITLREERFNQHATPGSMILEVGTAWNTLQEALLAIDLFSETAGPVLAEAFCS